MRFLYLILLSSLSAFSCTQASKEPLAPAPPEEITSPEKVGERPLMKDFIGLNGHFTFKPDFYKPISRLVRIYHNLDWDVQRPGDQHQPPFAVNGVNWKVNLYQPLKNAGWELDICLQLSTFNNENPEHQKLWQGQQQWEQDYARTMAEYYGPGGAEKLASSIEIGNEPGNRFQASLYKDIFKNMATGIRQGDPDLKIVTPYITTGKSNPYAQSLSGIYDQPDILPLYDVLNLHCYASINSSQGPFNRSYPEDPAIDYLKEIDQTIAWRDQHAPDKEIWITEFGYDAASSEAEASRSGEALTYDWRGFTDEQQAQYLVRSLLVFAERDVQRAYIYYYDDQDEAFMHSASGITRNFVPKQSYWALKQLQENLGEYRLNRIIQKQPKDVYIYEFVHGQQSQQRVWVVWSPTGTQTHLKENYTPRQEKKVLTDLPAQPQRVEGMAVSQSGAPQAKWETIDEHSIQLTLSESPQYIFFTLP